LDASAQTVRMRKDCVNDETCEVIVKDVMELIRHNNLAMEVIEKLDARVKELEAQAKAPPQCAKVDVTEPSKNPAPKPIPPIKRENDS
jgi:hypothetical protein